MSMLGERLILCEFWGFIKLKNGLLELHNAHGYRLVFGLWYSLKSLYFACDIPFAYGPA